MEIKFYEDTAGRVPVIEFLDSLDIKMRQKMLRSIQALQDMGISLRMPLSESLEMASLSFAPRREQISAA